jgi:hypothetical protein
MEFTFDDLGSCDLVVDATYPGGTSGNVGDDPISKLLRVDDNGVGNMGGFRYSGSLSDDLAVVVLYTTGMDRDWPDTLDPQTGLFTYFGDNKIPGKEIHDTSHKGNLILKQVFAETHSDNRNVPPFLIFEKSGQSGRDVIFKGLAAPGGPSLSSDVDLTAVWRTTGGKRFQNYRANFTVLNAPTIDRRWLSELYAGNHLGEYCPEAWQRWRNTGKYSVLTAPRTVEHRSKQDQLPKTDDDEGTQMLKTIHEYFQPQPIKFEHCAAKIWQMIEPNATDIAVTPPSRDGGRDAIGRHHLGPSGDRVAVDFALEAKCYATDNAVGVREVSRLISRLLHRQYGVLVTTSYVGNQPYQEIRQDGHPVIIVSGRDIVETLRAQGLTTVDAILNWLKTEFPISTL